MYIALPGRSFVDSTLPTLSPSIHLSASVTSLKSKERSLAAEIQSVSSFKVETEKKEEHLSPAIAFKKERKEIRGVKKLKLELVSVFRKMEFLFSGKY